MKPRESRTEAYHRGRPFRWLLASPDFPGEEDKTRSAKILSALLANFSGILAAALAANLFIFANKVLNALFLLALLGLILGSKALSWRGRVKAASHLLVSGLWIVFAAMYYLGGRSFSASALFFVSLTVLAGLLSGTRFMFAIFSLSSAFVLALALLETKGVPLPHAFPFPPLATWADFVFSIWILIFPLRVAIREREAALERSRAEAARYRLLYEKAPVMYAILREEDGAPVIDSCNELFLSALGYGRDEVLGRPIADFLTPASRAAFCGEGGYELAPNGERTTRLERDFVTKGGRVLSTQLQATEEAREGEGAFGVRVLAAYLDVTERKRAEERLKSSLDEEEALFRELYHRTRNNMTVIDAMLNLVAEEAVSPQVRQDIEGLQRRIGSMALVHEKLYEERNLSSIDLGTYIKELAERIMAESPEKADKVSLRLELGEVRVLIDTAIPCAMILHELISNALRHGFPGGAEGEIAISLGRGPGGEIGLAVTDDGLSPRPGFDPARDGRMGFYIVQSLSSQLRTEPRFSFERGFSCSLSFRDDQYEPRLRRFGRGDREPG